MQDAPTLDMCKRGKQGWAQIVKHLYHIASIQMFVYQPQPCLPHAQLLTFARKPCELLASPGLSQYQCVS